MDGTTEPQRSDEPPVTPAPRFVCQPIEADPDGFDDEDGFDCPCCRPR